MAEAELSWKKSGKKQTAAEIAAIAEKLGFVFPQDYARYLEQVNGGVPSHRMFESPTGHQTISYFYELSDIRRETLHFRSELQLPSEFLPIALAETNIVVLNAGKAQLWSMIESGFDRKRIYDIAESFSAFLGKLQKKLATPPFEKFITAIGMGEVARVRKFIDEGIDINGGSESAVEHAILVSEFAILELLLEAGGSQTLPNGTSLDDRLRGNLEGQRAVIKGFGPATKQGQKATERVEVIERILRRFFPASKE
jgi:hypothetical protein